MDTNRTDLDCSPLPTQTEVDDKSCQSDVAILQSAAHASPTCVNVHHRASHNHWELLFLLATIVLLCSLPIGVILLFFPHHHQDWLAIVHSPWPGRLLWLVVPFSTLFACKWFLSLAIDHRWARTCQKWTVSRILMLYRCFTVNYFHVMRLAMFAVLLALLFPNGSLVQTPSPSEPQHQCTLLAHHRPSSLKLPLDISMPDLARKLYQRYLDNSQLYTILYRFSFQVVTPAEPSSESTPLTDSSDPKVGTVSRSFVDKSYALTRDYLDHHSPLDPPSPNTWILLVTLGLESISYVLFVLLFEPFIHLLFHLVMTISMGVVDERQEQADRYGDDLAVLGTNHTRPVNPIGYAL